MPADHNCKIAARGPEVQRGYTIGPATPIFHSGVIRSGRSPRFGRRGDCQAKARASTPTWSP